MNVQYWRSFEDLENFARNPSDPHLQAWRDRNRRVGSNGSVGIWHETFKVNAGECECVYGNMPLFGLAAATEHVPAIGNRETARLRLGGHGEPAVASPPTPGAERNTMAQPKNGLLLTDGSRSLGDSSHPTKRKKQRFAGTPLVPSG